MSAHDSVVRAVSVVKSPAPRKLRNVKQVPFVELYGGRLQGVVSSGSDPNRVYVSFFNAGSMEHACSTNNNRPCGGYSVCSHLTELFQQAVESYGPERVARYLQLPGDTTPATTAHELINRKRGGSTRAEVSAVFSRFLSYLRYVELPADTEPNPEMAWFVTG